MTANNRENTMLSRQHIHDEDSALRAFAAAAARYPTCSVTLLRVYRKHSGKPLGYRLDVPSYLMPLRNESRVYCVPIRHA